MVLREECPTFHLNDESKVFPKAIRMMIVLNRGNKSEKGPSLDWYPMLPIFRDVFPKELLGLPLRREIDFTIELKLGFDLISKTPYRMTNPNFYELKM